MRVFSNLAPKSFSVSTAPHGKSNACIQRDQIFKHSNPRVFTDANSTTLVICNQASTYSSVGAIETRNTVGRVQDYSTISHIHGSFVSPFRRIFITLGTQNDDRRVHSARGRRLTIDRYRIVLFALIIRNNTKHFEIISLIRWWIRRRFRIDVDFRFLILGDGRSHHATRDVAVSQDDAR